MCHWSTQANININILSIQRFTFFKEHSLIQKGLNALLQSVVILSVQSVTPREISHGSFRLADILKYSFVTLWAEAMWTFLILDVIKGTQKLFRTRKPLFQSLGNKMKLQWSSPFHIPIATLIYCSSLRQHNNNSGKACYGQTPTLSWDLLKSRLWW